MHMFGKVNSVLFRAFAIFSPCDDVRVGTVTFADNITCNVGVRGGKGPRLLHELSLFVFQAKGTTMEIAFHETVRLEELDDLRISPILTWRRPFHTYNPSPVQDFIREFPEIPKQLLEQRDVPPKFLKRSEIVVSDVDLFVDILPWGSPRTWDRAPQGNMARTCPNMIHRVLQTSRGGHVNVTGQPDARTL